MNTEIYIATHKPAKFDLPDEYRWVQVNAAKVGAMDGYLHDSDWEDNISSKNPSYCELTALYLLWKASTADFVGLCHYRRFFGRGLLPSLAEESGIQFKKQRIGALILRHKQIKRYLKDYDIILTKPYCPFPVNAYEDLLRFVYPSDIEAMISSVETHYPEYSEDLWSVLKSKGISYCNMFITKRETAASYCAWLFDILSIIEQKIDISSYDTSHTRIFGYLAEVLLNVYVRKNQLAIKYVPMITPDEDETPVPIKRKIALSSNVLLLALGIAPKRWHSSLWRSRRLYYRTQKEPEYTSDASPINNLSAYFIAAGADSIFTKESPFNYIRTTLGFNTIHAFWCEADCFPDELLREIETVSQTDSSFGETQNIRVYVPRILDKEKHDSIIQKAFYYVDDGLFKYFCYKNISI